MKLLINAGILLILSCYSPVNAQDVSLKILSSKIENAFNSKDLSKIDKLFDNQIVVAMKKKFLAFQKDFPNAKWDIKQGDSLKDNRKSIELVIKSIQKKGTQIYDLKTKQRIAVEIKEGKIINPEIISEESILKNTNKPINLTLQIPDAALTGSRYDIDIIINQPLEHSIIAGKLIPFDYKNSINKVKKDIDLLPMGSGGIFKSVEAPMQPGNQIWAAIIVHPEGMISITKLVKIVSNENDLDL